MAIVDIAFAGVDHEVDLHLIAPRAKAGEEIGSARYPRPFLVARVVEEIVGGIIEWCVAGPVDRDVCEGAGANTLIMNVVKNMALCNVTAAVFVG